MEVAQMISTAFALCITLAVVLGALGGALFLPVAARGVKAVPRAVVPGWVLSALCWVWITAELYLHPIDFLAFLTPKMTLLLGVICIPLSWVLLANLLCARAIGGLMMLWPMPVILAVRDFETAWRLVPVTLGYISLTFGMFVVFYPWLMRVVCDALARSELLRRLAGVGLLLAGCLCVVTACSLGKVVGQ